MQFLNSYKIFFLVILFTLICIFIYLIENYKFNISNKIIFVGHAYGKHGELIVPENSLKKFLQKNKPQLIFFGGDMTEKPEDYKIFKDYFIDNEYKYYVIKGNHDETLWQYEKKWSEISINNLNFYNMDMDETYDFNYEIFSEYKNTIFLSHFVWFNKLFEDIGVNVANQIIYENFLKMKLNEIDNFSFGDNNYFIAGDCGAFTQNLPYIKTWYKNSQFLCTGIGNKIGHNIVILDDDLNPIFFDNNGEILNHKCKVFIGSLMNKIEVCLPKIDKYNKKWENLYKKSR